MAMDIAGKPLQIRNVPGPTGVRGRRSDNRLVLERLGWTPSQPLRVGLESTFAWIKARVDARAGTIGISDLAVAN